METVEARQSIFRQQVDRLVTFSLDYIARHRDDLRALDRQRDNLLQAMLSCGQYLGDWSRAAQMALGLEEYVLRRGQWQSWAVYLEQMGRALEEAGQGAMEGEIWHALGNAYCGAGRYEEAIRAHRRAIEAFRAASDLGGLAHAWFDLGRARWFRGEWKEAVRCYRRADAHARSLPDGSFLRARIANVMGLVYWRQGWWRRAARHFRRALRLCPDGAEYARNRGRMMSNLALALTDLDRWEEAERAFRTALRLSEQADDTTGLAYTCGDLSDLYRRQGRWEEAEVCLERAATLWEQAEDGAGRADHAEHRGRLCAGRGEVAQARRWLDQALRLWETLGNEHKAAELRVFLAAVAVRQRSSHEADRRIEQARSLARRLGRRDLLVWLHGLWATVEERRGHRLRAAWIRWRGLACGLPALFNDRTRRAVKLLLLRGDFL